MRKLHLITKNYTKLSRTNYSQSLLIIRDIEIETYKEVVEALLHDVSPIETCTHFYDTFENVALALQENPFISHMEFSQLLAKIFKILNSAFESMGYELDV